MMKRWFHILGVGSEVPPVQLVFFTTVVVMLFQIPAHALIRSGWISYGILTNELIAIAGVPLAVVFAMRFDRGRILPHRWPGILTILLVAVATGGADIIIDYLTAASEYFYPLPDWVEEAFERLMAAHGLSDVVGKILLLCVVTGICEEIFFRGFCQTSLEARWGAWPALVVQAVIFAALHGNPWHGHLYFILGLFLGWIYLVTGTLVAPVICHILNNMWAFSSHAYGLKFPLGGDFGFTDALVLASGVILFLSSVLFLRRSAFPTKRGWLPSERRR